MAEPIDRPMPFNFNLVEGADINYDQCNSIAKSMVGFWVYQEDEFGCKMWQHQSGDEAFIYSFKDTQTKAGFADTLQPNYLFTMYRGNILPSSITTHEPQPEFSLLSHTVTPPSTTYETLTLALHHSQMVSLLHIPSI